MCVCVCVWDMGISTEICTITPVTKFTNIFVFFFLATKSFLEKMPYFDYTWHGIK